MTERFCRLVRRRVREMVNAWLPRTPCGVRGLVFKSYNPWIFVIHSLEFGRGELNFAGYLRFLVIQRAVQQGCTLLV